MTSRITFVDNQGLQKPHDSADYIW